MRENLLTIPKWLLLLFLAALTSCGSGGSSSSAPETSDSPESPAGNGVEYTPVTTSENKLGAWIFYIDEPGLVHNNHQDMAAYLADTGVKRVFIKISDINYQWQNNKLTFTDTGVNCGVWQDACEPDNLQYYKDEGLEVWAWTYNDVHSFEEQADMLEAAIKVGYDGFVMDIEVEFDGKSDLLKQLLDAHQSRLNSLADITPAHFKFTATSWGNPKDHAMDIGLIDQYVDAHLPQTYIEKWGGSYLTDIANAIRLGDCEYRDLGAQKPIWHIISHEDDILSAADFDQFINYAGPNVSIWRIASQDKMTELNAIDWGVTSFESQDCSLNNFELN